MDEKALNKTVKTSVEVSIRLILMFLLVAWCLFLLLPFLEPVLWGAIIAVSLSPLYHQINNLFGDKPKLTSSIIVLVFLAVLIVPAFLTVLAMTDKVGVLMDLMDQGQLNIPPPDASVQSWPLVGERIYAIWSSFSSNIETALNDYEGQLAQAGKAVLNSILNLSTTIAMFLFSIVIAGVLLATRGTDQLNQKVFTRVLGDNGAAFAKLSENTIRSVTKGVIGVAFIQAILLGILFALAGVPYAGIWGALCLILGVMQLPPTLVSIPVVIYIFSVSDGVMGTVWAALIILSGFVDNILKPILMGKGSTVPMLVVFLGSLGGFMTTGFLGLFTGAIVLSIGYELFMAWINTDVSKE
jgi:predicted PurR-regulated permease PerM